MMMVKNIDQGIEIIEIVKPKGIKEEDDILLRDENKFQIKFKLNDSKKLKDGYILILNFRYQMCDEKNRYMLYATNSRIESWY